MKAMGWTAAATASVVIFAGATLARSAVAQGVRVPAVWMAPERVIVQPAAAEPQAKDDLLDGLDKLGANAKERNEVNLDKNMMGLAAGKKGGRYADLAQKMDFIVVRNYEFASKGQYAKSDLDALRRRLDSNGWSHLVRNESGDDSNEICIRTDHDGLISDMVILNAEPKELNIVHLRGRFRMEDVQGAMGSAMSGAMGSMGRMTGPEPPVPAEPPAKKH